MAMTFATRYRTVPVLVGITIATVATHAISVGVGYGLGATLPTGWIALVAALAFFGFAAWTLRGDSLTDEEEQKAGMSNRSAIVAVAIAIFGTWLHRRDRPTSRLRATHPSVEGFRLDVSPSSDDEYVEFLSSRLPRLTQTAYLLCGDRHRAEDIVQAMALKLYVKWRRARAAANLDGYVHRMLVREFSRQGRLGWSRVLVTDRLPERSSGPWDDVENRDTVLAGLARLPVGQREVIVLRFYSDLSVDRMLTGVGANGALLFESNLNRPGTAIVVRGEHQAELAAPDGGQVLGIDFDGYGTKVVGSGWATGTANAAMRTC